MRKFAAPAAGRAALPRPVGRMILEPESHEPGGRVASSWGQSHEPGTRQMAEALAFQSHDPGKVTNDLPWNPAHRAIQGPLQGVLRTHGRPVRKAAALTLKMLRQILLTCDQSARGRRDRALLLFGVVGALRRSELVAP